MKYKLIQGDCLEVMRTMPNGLVDLTVCSPPYEDRREYEDIKFDLVGEDWVAWMIPRIHEMVRVTRGLVAVVVSDRTENYEWSAATALLTADLKRAGCHLRRPPIYKRHGIMGSGGPDWLANCYEPIICLTHGGPLPWAMPLACGHPPKYGPGGPPTHRNRDGKRKTRRKRDGTLEVQAYKNPEIANPGNIIDCGAVGGGKMGSRIAHENEAPFPEKIPNFFIRSFCPPDGLVMDAFCGSGTTGGECAKLGRNFIGIDLRKSQIDLTYRRIQEAKTKAGFLL